MSERTGYWIAMSRASFGWRASVTNHGDGDVIGVTGPTRWGLTYQAALRRAMRYVRRHTREVEEFPAADISTVWIGR